MGFTKLISAAINACTVDATPIGSTTPSTARFITPASGDNSTNAATTAWCLLGFAASSSANGYIKLPAWLSGLIIQWGHVTTDINAGTVTVTFPLVFPTAAFVVVPTTLSATDRITYVVNGSLTTSSFRVGNNGSGGFAYWIAIGH
jgi:hypothetical protein